MRRSRCSESWQARSGIRRYRFRDYQPACVAFHRTERAARTLRADQVQPIHREGLEHWRHYEPWLGPLKAALAPPADATAP